MNNRLSRREFFKFSAMTTAMLAIPKLAYSQQFGDYKAVIHLYLAGGNDSFNMIVPTNQGDVTDGTSHAYYKSIRGAELGVNNVSLDLSPYINNGALDLNRSGSSVSHTNDNNPYFVEGSSGQEEASYIKGYYDSDLGFGINALMPEVAYLQEQGKVAVIAGAGSLVEPVTRITVRDKTAKLPHFLYAHNHQRSALMTGWANNLKTSGWAGRLSDRWGDVNNGSTLGMNISYQGSTQALVGNTSTPLVLATGQPELYNPTFSEDMKTVFDNATTDTSVNEPFRRIFKEKIKKSFNLEVVLTDAWESSVDTFSAVTNAYDNPLFEIPDKETIAFDGEIKGRLIKQMESVARMIKYGHENGLKRQVFFVSLEGFDNHTSQKSRHPAGLRELSLAIADFQLAMAYLGLEDNVATFVTSEFGRSLGVNSSGTDHAWGGHYFTIGGAINSSQLHGEMPDLTLSGDNDTGRRGRLIPQISFDQYQGAIAHWFGADEVDLDVLFPNLKNFKTDSTLVSALLPLFS